MAPPIEYLPVTRLVRRGRLLLSRSATRDLECQFLKARLDRVTAWLEVAAPDILMMQEPKLSDEAAPLLPFQLAGYDVAHHGEGRWNGVAIASRVGLEQVSLGFQGSGPDADGARFLAGNVRRHPDRHRVCAERTLP
ncbi:hypothetical protein BH20CHL6_BH20CHL6_05890 [soil metagenome]